MRCTRNFSYKRDGMYIQMLNQPPEEERASAVHPPLRSNMEVFSIILSLALLWIIILVLRSLRVWFNQHSRFLDLIERIPGPPTTPILGNALSFIRRPQDELLDELNGFVKLYNPLFRLWFGPVTCTVLVSSWKYAEKIFNSTTYIEKSTFYSFLKSWLGTGLLISTGDKWHFRRKLLTPAFHRTVLEGYQEVICEKSEQFVKILSSMTWKGQPIDIAPLVWKCSLDIICETAMNTKMNIQGNLEEKDAAYLAAVGEVSAIFLRRSVNPWEHSDIVFNLMPNGRRFKKCVKIMHDFTKKVIQKKKLEYLQSCEKKNISNENLNGKKRKSFLDLLIESAYSEGSHRTPILSDEDIREEVDTFMFEGHDTTASSISWTLYLIGCHPEIQESLYQEIKVTLGDEMDFTYQKLSELQLLERVIKESLRLYPSVPFIGRKLKEDIKLGEYIIPSQTEVFILIYFINRNPEIFPNPENFDPDNFLPEACEKRHPYAYVPFSAGARNCIGQKFAMLEEKIVLSHILKSFLIEAVDDAKDLKLLVDIVLRSANGINLKLYPRL